MIGIEDWQPKTPQLLQKGSLVSECLEGSQSVMLNCTYNLFLSNALFYAVDKAPLRTLTQNTV
jgi:hypothetical protein